MFYIIYHGYWPPDRRTTAHLRHFSRMLAEHPQIDPFCSSKAVEKLVLLRKYLSIEMNEYE